MTTGHDTTRGEAARRQIHVSELRRGDRFTLTERGRKIDLAYNTPRVPRGGTYVVRTGPHDGQTISFLANDEATVWVVPR